MNLKYLVCLVGKIKIKFSVIMTIMHVIHFKTLKEVMP